MLFLQSTRNYNEIKLMKYIIDIFNFQCIFNIKTIKVFH